MKPYCTNTEWVGHARCAACEVRNIVLFSSLAEAELNRLLHPIDNLHVPAGSTLYQAGDPAPYLFTLRHGLIKLTVDLPDGDYRIVRLLRPGDIAGLEALVGTTYHHNAVMLRDADICRIPCELVQQLDQTQSEIHRQLLLRWQKAIDQADNLIVSLTSGKVEERLARLLLMVCQEEQLPLAMLGREDMAALLGVSTESASRAMAELKRRNLVKEEKGICVFCNTGALKSLGGA